MKRTISAVLMITLLLVAGGCAGKREASAPDAKLKIVTTIGMITDVVRTIAGDRAEVIGLMGPGVDPHLYKASHGDVERLANADIIFYNGLHLEGKMVDMLVKMARRRPVIAVAGGVPKDELREPPEFEGQYDPHIWMVPRLWKYGLTVIADELSELRPQFAPEFRARSDSLGLVFDELHHWAISEIGTIPDEQRVLITAHDAFGYFGEAYGIEVRGLQGISTTTDYGIADVTQLVGLLTERRIRAVFVESSVPTKPLEAVTEGCKSRGHTVRIGGTLYSDAMGKDGTLEGTYPGMIRHNVSTVVRGLK